VPGGKIRSRVIKKMALGGDLAAAGFRFSWLPPVRQILRILFPRDFE